MTAIVKELNAMNSLVKVLFEEPTSTSSSQAPRALTRSESRAMTSFRDEDSLDALFQKKAGNYFEQVDFTRRSIMSGIIRVALKVRIRSESWFFFLFYEYYVKTVTSVNVLVS